MTIQLISVAQQGAGKWRVGVKDTADVIGVDEKGADIHRTYSVNYYPAKGVEDLKDRFEAKIRASKQNISVDAQINSDIKATVESIDPTTLEV